jgi:23S rRNA G2445 N2-methylase RlmL
VKNIVRQQFLDQFGKGPNVNLDDADLPLFLYLHRDICTIYRVWSGSNSMHKRGYRFEPTTSTTAAETKKGRYPDQRNDERSERKEGPIHKAMFKETTAAILLQVAGWKTPSPTTPTPSSIILCDPMCGSGTFLIEAAMISCQTAPSLLRYQHHLPTPCQSYGRVKT